jgi:RepB DNA-primase from phage plasmid
MERFRIGKGRALAQMNAQGNDIYLRPLDGPELLLVDALNAEAVKDMHRRGLAPAVTVETSPGRFQAWVKVSEHPLPEGVRRPTVAGLACGFSKVGKFGRLAGFTNQQAAQNRAGRQPYVLASDSRRKVAAAAQPYLDALDRPVREHAAERQRLAQVGRERLIQLERQELVKVEKTTRAPRRDRGRSR